jgi:hypothetical protein
MNTYQVVFKRSRGLINGMLAGFTLCLFISCGGDSSESAGQTGSLSFQIQWETVGSDISGQVADPSGIDCDGEGVFWVNAVIYDRLNQYITESDPWHCYAHAGTMEVPAGSDRKVVIFGKNAANEILYRGQKSHINISGNRITDAGLIVANYFVPTDGDSTYCGTYPNYYFSWKAVKSAASYEFQIARDISFESLMVSVIIDNPKTDCYSLNYIDNPYYWRVRSIDFDGFKSAWSQIWVHNSAV